MGQDVQRAGFTHESPRNETVEWYTPKFVFDALGLTFDLDPCSPGAKVVPWVPAKRHLTRADDGLAQPWAGRVWLNPPYGRETPEWLARLADHGNGVALVFARTDTGWFHESITRADAVCFIAGRIRFVRPDGTEGGTPGSGSMLVAYGADNAVALRACGLGVVVSFDRAAPSTIWRRVAATVARVWSPPDFSASQSSRGRGLRSADGSTT